MQNYKIKKSVILSILGLISILSGIVVVKLFPEWQPMLKVLPFLCVGIGVSIFGDNLGKGANNYILSKNPIEAKKATIEENDERNTMIKNKAKAKAYNLVQMVLGALILAFALLGVEIYIVITLVGAYLFINLSNVYYLLKYQKQM